MGEINCYRKITIQANIFFIRINASLRTNETFRNKTNARHHSGTSPFEKTNLDMIYYFPLDPMHLVQLEKTKKILLVLSSLSFI